MLHPIKPKEIFTAICIETVNLCNRKCWFCKFGQLTKEEPKEWMAWALIEKIVYNLRDLKFKGRISWYRINEPLLDKRIYDIIKLTKREVPYCYQSILTNGDLLTVDKVEKLFISGIDGLGVSVYDDETMLKCTAAGYERCRIIDRRPSTEGGFVENRGGNIELITLETKKKAAEQSWIEKNCLRPSTMINIVPNGNVVLCCADLYGDVVMGNVKEQKLEEIWRGSVFEKYRKHLATLGRKGLQLCENCTHNGRGHKLIYP